MLRKVSQNGSSIVWLWKGPGECFYESELLRLRGDLLVSARSEGAEQCFRHAREAARRQQARRFERHAIASLRALLDREGRSEEARQLDAVVDRTSALTGHDG